MRGDDNLQEGIFSYISPEKRVPTDHPLRPIRKLVQEKFQPKERSFFLTSPFIALATPAGWLYEPETPAETDSELPGR